MKRIWIAIVLTTGLSAVVLADEAAIGKHDDRPSVKNKSNARGFSAIEELIATVHPTTGNETRGVVRFRRAENNIKVIADVQGLTPNKKHGFHIHNYGDCGSTDATSAGGHYDPEGHPHASPDAALRHAGDLGNLEADENGAAHYERFFDNITLAGDHNPVLGRSVIIHAGEDDLSSQPTGNAGARIGCGVIGISKPQ